MNKKLLLKILLFRSLRKQIMKKKRSIYIRPIFLNRNIQGDNILLNELRADEDYHFKYLRMDKANFDELLRKVQEKLFHQKTHARPITPMERLAITLRFLATGNSQISLAFSYSISPSSICMIIKETMSALCESLAEEYLPSPSQKIWTKNEVGFSSKWNFPNVCGAIDGKHIRIRAPKQSGSTFFNYKSYFSIVLLGIANANYMFTAVDIGSSGSESDGGILMRSNIGKKMSSNTFELPNPKPVSENGPVLPQVVLGDSGFPLKPYLMTPYKGDFLSKENKIFNYRLSRARMVVENGFGILAARWRIFHTPIDADTETVKLLTKTCIILHNFLISKKDLNDITTDCFENEETIPGNWRETTQSDAGMATISAQGSNDFSKNAADIRKEFKNYLINDGRVNWQESYVSRS